MSIQQLSQGPIISTIKELQNRPIKMESIVQYTISQNWRLTEILFSGGRGAFSSEENVPGGLLMHGITRGSLHKHSHLPPKQSNHAKVAVSHAGNVHRNAQNLSLDPKYRAEQLPEDFYTSGVKLYCNSSDLM